MNNSNHSDDDAEPLFKSFQWHRQEVNNAKISGQAFAILAGRVRDITSGCATILEMIEFDELQDDCGGRRIMSACESGNLTRLAIQSLQLLSERAEEAITWAYDYKTPEGEAARSKR